MKGIIRKILTEEREGRKPTLIFVAGIDTSKSKDEQASLLRNGSGSDFNIISHRHTDKSGILKSIEENPNAYVMLFSAGTKFSGEVAKRISDLSKLYIVEPFKGIKGIVDSAKGSNLFWGSQPGVGGNTYNWGQLTPNCSKGSWDMDEHWCALTEVGRVIKGNSMRDNV